MAVIDNTFYPVKDFAKSAVATAPSPATSGTSLVVTGGEGSKFPQPSTDGQFRAYVWPASTEPTTTNCEEIEVTVRSTDTFTIVRAQGGTSARTILVGDNIAINYGKTKEDQFLTAIKDGWVEDKLLPSESYSRDSVVQFKTPGDKTGFYTTGRIIRINNSGSYSYHVVASSSYSAPDTTVIVYGTDIPASISNIYINIQGKGATGLYTPNDLFLQSDVFRQVLINGNFDHWLEGTSVTPNDDVYVASLWNALQEANAAWTFAQDTDIPSTGNHKYSLKASCQTADKQCALVQFIENVNAVKFQGKKVSLSFYAKTNGSEIANLRATVLSWTGTADTLTSDVVGTWAQNGTDPTWASSYTSEKAGSNLALTSSWQRFTIENINLDTSSITNLAVVIWVDDGTISVNDDFYITGVQLNVGEIALPYNPKFHCDELIKIQRLLYKSTVDSTNGASFPCVGIGHNTTDVYYTFFLPIRMRVAPTLSTSTVSGFNFYHDDAAGGAIAITSFTTRFSSPQVISVTGASAGTTVAKQPYFLTSGSGSDNYLLFDARL